MAGAGSKDYKLAIRIAGRLESSFNSAIGAAQKSISALGDAATKAAQIGAMAVGAATTAVVAFAKSSVDTGMEFDKSVSQIAATMGKPVDEISELREQALKMGAETSFSAAEAAEGLNILAMAGLSAEEQIAAIPDVLNLAAAGAISMENAASYTAGAVKGFSDEMGNAHYYADLIAKGATLANTSVEGLGESLSRSAATAAGYSQSADSVTLSLLRLADQNVTGEAAATALSRAMADIYTPTASAKKALTELGVSAYDVTTGAARDFNDVVADLNKVLSGMTDEQKNAYAATIFTTQGLNAFNKMTAATDETMQKFTDGLANVDGSAAQQAATQLNNLAGDITLFNSALDVAKIKVADQINPMLREFVQFGTKSVDTLSQAFQSGGLTGVMDALGGILSEGLNMVVGQLPGMINAGMQLLGALGQGLLDNLPTITNAAIEVVSMFASGLAEAFPSLAAGAAQLVQQLADTITTNTPALADGIVNAIPQFVSTGGELLGALGNAIIQNIPVLAQAAITIMTGLGGYLKQNLPGILDSGLEFVSTLTQSIRENAGLIVDGAIGLAVSLAQGLADSIPTIVEHIPEIVSNIANIINDNAPKLVQAAFTLIVTLGKGLIDAIPTIIANIPQIIGAIVDTLTAFNWLNLGSSILKGIGSGAKSAISFVKNIGKQALEAIKGGFANLPHEMAAVGKNVLKGLWSGITGTFGWLKSKIGEIFGSIVSTVKDFFGIHSPSTVFADIGENLILGLFEGISEIWDTITGFFSGAVDGILSFFSGLWGNVQNIWSAVSGWFKSTVIDPLVSFFVPIDESLGGPFTTAWEIIKAVWNTVAAYFQAVFDTIAGIFSFVASVLSGDFSGAWEAIKGIVSTWAAYFGTVWEGIKAVFGAVASWFGGVFSAAWEAVKAVFAPVGAFFQSLWDTIVGLFTSIGTAVGDAISGAVKGAINAVLKGAIGIINGFIGAINTAIEVINAIPGVSIETLQKLEVPQLAKGGIVTAPTLLEAGEAGNEAIIPLGELWGNMQDMIATNMSGTTDGIAALADRLDAANIGANTPSIADLLGQLNNPDDDDSPDGNGGPPVQIIYSPTNHYHFEGDAPKQEDIAGAESMSQEEFNRRMDEYFKQQQRTRFRG